jgi:hypothetical protein
MARKGWSLSETARQTSRILGPDAKFGRAHMWHYLRVGTVPRGRYVEALSQSLGVEAAVLLGTAPPSSGPSAAEQAESRIRVEDVGDGFAQLNVLQRVPWETALEVMRALANDHDCQSNP